MTDRLPPEGQEPPELLTAWGQQLQVEHNWVRLTYAPVLRPIPIALSEGRSRWGTYQARPRLITISRHLIREYPWPVVIEILKHEMAHQYVWEVKGSADRHGPVFQEACRILRVPSWAASASGELPHDIPDGQGFVDPPDSEAFRLLRRAEKLLALAESANEHEAALAMQRVRELYARHNLEALRLRAPRNYVNRTISLKRLRKDVLDSLIVDTLCSHFMVNTVFTQIFDASTLRNERGVDLLGTRENVEMAEYVYHFLRHRAESLWQRHKATTRAPANHRTDFLHGLFHAFNEKLRAPVLTPEETALVRAKDAGLERFKRWHYPYLRTTSSSGGGVDAGAFASGVTEGKALNIHKGVHGHAGNRGGLLGRD